MKSSFMHERLSTLEKQMQGALDFADNMTELDARNVRINCMYLRLTVGESVRMAKIEGNAACLVCNTTGLGRLRRSRLQLVLDQHRGPKDKNKRKPPRSAGSQWICCVR